MIHETLLQVLAHPADGMIAIVTQGESEPHVVNTWNSYVKPTPEGRLLIPAGGMHRTEQNLERCDRIKLTIGSREVQGLRYQGTGFLVSGTGRMLHTGPEFEELKITYPWLRAVLEVAVETCQQTL